MTKRFQATSERPGPRVVRAGPTAIVSAAPVLSVTAASRGWRRRLGPLAWTVLEELALASHLTDRGWVAPIGVRDVAAGIGVTKDTAARAVAALSAAGLVILDRVEGLDGRSRSGYRLRPPGGLTLRTCPHDGDTITPTACAPRPDGHDSRCPEGADGALCPPGQGSPPWNEMATGRRLTARTPANADVSYERRHEKSSGCSIQPTLSPPPVPPSNDPIP